MNTISSNFPSSVSASFAGGQNALGRSLIGLSARTQPADSGADGLDQISLSAPADQVARQNRLSALADAPAAAAANQSAAAGIAAQPATALSVQANLAPETAWSVLQSD